MFNLNMATGLFKSRFRLHTPVAMIVGELKSDVWGPPSASCEDDAFIVAAKMLVAVT